MASSLSPLHQDLLCPICLEIFTGPVLLTCGHSFCRACIQQSWTQRSERECPICKRRSSREHPTDALALRNACESYLQQQKKDEGSRSQGILCSLHSENLNLFCVDDEKLVCGRCVTQNHQNHSFCSISKAADSRKKTLQEHLRILEKKLQIFKNAKDIDDKVAAHIKSQSMQTESQMKDAFEKLHQFLRKEEKIRISALRKEEEEKSQKIKKNIEELNKQIKEISSRITESEARLNNDTLFLQDIKGAIERAQYTVPDPHHDSVALIDVNEHLGNLSYRVWEKMKDLCPYYPVILDPNTANSSLSISVDLSTVSLSTEKSQLPDNPERFSANRGVLASEGFSAGTHSWEMEVGDSGNWIIGVAEESISKKENLEVVPENGFFCIWRRQNDIVAGISNSSEKIVAPPTVKRICVTLCFERGRVTFSSADTSAALYTFKHKLKKKMYPYFFNGSNTPLNILPFQISITTKHNEKSTK